jgi:putative spermidine/putrescine transport system substrate-binding protein
MTNLTRRSLLKTSAFAAGALAIPAIVRAQTNQLVIGCAASHSNWMEALVVPHMRTAIGAEVIFEGTRSAVNLEKMVSNRGRQYLSVVQMDDPVMLQAVQEGLLHQMTPAMVPNLAQLREGAVHLEGMWAGYAQPWSGIAYNTDALPGVDSWADLWAPAARGRIIIPSLQNTEGMWTVFMAAMLQTGLPFAQAQYEIDAAFEKLAALRENVLSVYTSMPPAFNLLEQGEITMMPGNFSSFTLPRRDGGAPVDLAAPSEGIFVMPSGICLVEGGPNPELAAAYVNEMLSADLQSAIADFTSSLPTNLLSTGGADVPPGIGVYAPDWQFVSANRRSWTERFEQLMAL